MGTTPLYCSLFTLCQRQIASDPEFMGMCGLDSAPQVDAQLFEEYRLFKLRRMLAYVAERSRFYRKLFADAGIKAGDMRSIADLGAVPLTGPADLAAEPYAFLCISRGQVEWAITFSSSGTVGPKKRVFFSEADIEAITDYMGAGMKTVADESDVVQILLPRGPACGQSDLLARGVAKMGGRSVVTGMFAPPEEQIETVRKNGSTVMFGETHLIYRLTKVMEKTCDLSALGMRTLFLSTSYASPVMIDYLGRTWNARISTHYGMTEMGLGLAVDCPVCGAYHFNELDVIGEVINPATGRTLPPGSAGELVFTTLQRDAMPFIRYRTRDLATFGMASDECGSPLHTIGHVKSRIESLVHLGNGSVLYPALFHDAFFSIPEVIDYELTVDTRDGGDLVIVDVEVDRPLDALRDRLVDTLRNDPAADGLKRAEAPVEVHFREPGSLQQQAHFKKVVADRRQHPVSREKVSRERMAGRMIARADFITS